MPSSDDDDFTKVERTGSDWLMCHVIILTLEAGEGESESASTARQERIATQGRQAVGAGAYSGPRPQSSESHRRFLLPYAPIVPVS
jgi:phosphatidylethanolamine-binding protein (PEBP) family uncharacterized protein